MGKAMVERDEPGAMVEAIEAVFRAVAAVQARVAAKALAVVQVVLLAVVGVELVEDEAKLVVEAMAAFAEVVRLEDERHLALHLVADHWEVVEEVFVARLVVVPTGLLVLVWQG